MSDALDPTDLASADDLRTPAALRALLEHLFDYAGLFPPAKLDMEPAIGHYHAAVTGPDQWMMERLVLPVGRLAEFEQHVGGRLPTGDEDEPWPITCLVAAAGQDDALERDLEQVAAFNGRHAEPGQGLALIDVVELKGGTSDAMEDALDAMPDELFPFFELPWDVDPRGLVAVLVGGDAGAKIRTGGLDASAFPSPAEVARFLRACAAADVPFKATAGLHHPLRHHAASVGCAMHGFLNVFVAATLALHHDLEAEALEPILAATTLDDFVIDERSLGFGDLTCTSEEVEDARLTFAISIGSCSFDEPRDDLRGLGLL